MFFSLFRLVTYLKKCVLLNRVIVVGIKELILLKKHLLLTIELFKIHIFRQLICYYKNILIRFV